MGFLLRNGNPQIRYAASVVARPTQLDLLIRALPGERCAIVRRAFARRVSGDADSAAPALDYALETETPEAVYVFERLLLNTQTDVLDSSELDLVRRSSLAPMLSALRAIVRRDVAAPGLRVLIRDLKISRSTLRRLDQAFSVGFQFGDRELLRELSIDAVHRAVRATSPFDEGGLGAYAELSAIDDIDRAFLQLSRLVFLSELGLLIDVGM